MVVIDAEKHGLDYKKSFVDNGIAGLKKRYQSATGGASTLLSKASSEADVNKRKEKTVYKSVKNMTPSELVDYKSGKKIMNMTPAELADHQAGKKVYEYTGDSYFKPLTTKVRTEKNVADMTPDELTKYNSGKKVYNKAVATKVEKNVADMTPEELAKHKEGKKIYEYSTTPTYKTIKSTKMAETDDAMSLSSGTAIELIYATHANKLKALANDARKLNLNTDPIVYSPIANKIYKEQVSSLTAHLNVALKNAPLERQAMLIAIANVKSKKLDNPDMEPSELKKAKSQALNEARNRMGAKKQRIDISDKEWEAIQAGAVTNTVVNKILSNTDLDKIKQLAMPRTNTITGLSPAKETRVRAMLASGNTQQDIANALGVPLASVKALM